MHRFAPKLMTSLTSATVTARRARVAQSHQVRSIIRPAASLGSLTVQRLEKEQPTSGNPSHQTAIPPSVSAVLRSSGQPLDSTSKAYFEPRFGQDFSQVRLHTDSAANASSRDIGARAYTHGPHIVFGRQEYNPGTATGRQLLAHELTHVVQQSQVASIVQRDPVDGEEDLLGQYGRAEDEARQTALDMAEPASDVYMCSKDLDTSPAGKHAFFRLGAPGKGNPTISLQPIDSSLGADCWQGIPDRNYPSDFNADGDCEPIPVSESRLLQEFRAYPIGHYCTWGPNSNTFVGEVARNCGITNPDPPGWTPGIDASAPPSGTYAPDKWTTLAGCVTKQCVIGPDDPGSDASRV